MTPLPRVTKALRRAHEQLPKREQIRDIAYLLDVDPCGSESLVLYVTLKRGSQVSPREQRELEAVLREKLRAAGGYQVFFRWLSEDEPGSGSALTRSGLVAAPISALKVGLPSLRGVLKPKVRGVTVEEMNETIRKVGGGGA
jgi:hypothetical protein